MKLNKTTLKQLVKESFEDMQTDQREADARRLTAPGPEMESADGALANIESYGKALLDLAYAEPDRIFEIEESLKNAMRYHEIAV